jgi:hypothetical protein
MEMKIFTYKFYNEKFECCFTDDDDDAVEICLFIILHGLLLLNITWLWAEKKSCDEFYSRKTENFINNLTKRENEKENPWFSSADWWKTHGVEAAFSKKYSYNFKWLISLVFFW